MPIHTLQEMIKFTEHSDTNSLEPYLQLYSEHHFKIVQNLRETASDQINFAKEAQKQGPIANG